MNAEKDRETLVMWKTVVEECMNKITLKERKL